MSAPDTAAYLRAQGERSLDANERRKEDLREYSWADDPKKPSAVPPDQMRAARAWCEAASEEEQPAGC